MATNRTIGVRLSADELRALRGNEGATDSERIRNLIRRETLADAIAQHVAASVAADLDEIKARIDRVEARQTRLIEAVSAVLKSGG